MKKKNKFNKFSAKQQKYKLSYIIKVKLDDLDPTKVSYVQNF